MCLFQGCNVIKIWQVGRKNHLINFFTQTVQEKNAHFNGPGLKNWNEMNQGRHFWHNKYGRLGNPKQTYNFLNLKIYALDDTGKFLFI